MFSFIKRSAKQSVEAALNTFDFVGVTERFDESMLVLKHMLNLDYSDIVYKVSKDSNGGGVDDKNYKFVPHPPYEQESEAVHKAANAFMERTRDDVAMYKAANRALDAAIALIPRFSLMLAEYEHNKVVAATCDVENAQGNYIVKKEFTNVESDPLKINLSQGDDVMVLSKEVEGEPGMWRGRSPAADGPEGTFPWSHVRDMSDREQTSQRYNCYYVDEGCGYPCFDRIDHKLPFSMKDGTLHTDTFSSES
jgi:hypothetical protein